MVPGANATEGGGSGESTLFRDGKVSSSLGCGGFQETSPGKEEERVSCFLFLSIERKTFGFGMVSLFGSLEDAAAGTGTGTRTAVAAGVGTSATAVWARCDLVSSEAVLLCLQRSRRMCVSWVWVAVVRRVWRLGWVSFAGGVSCFLPWTWTWASPSPVPSSPFNRTS